MAYIKKLLNDNFLYYASYVIMDRAIPELDDGLKPVQRRILHTLFEMDDGKFHKVANVVGHCMKYHPHGDASIGSALVGLANKGLFIETQGNFGNPVTGDEASAPRYIECRCTTFAKEVFFHPKITQYIDSYDGRNREPLVFPAKIPVVLMLGTEGIAVGMSTKILPHNPVEVIQAEVACLEGKSFALTPDFPTGGFIDASDYADGNGKVRVRALLDTSDPKKIVIKEVPYGSTTESLISSIEEGVRAGHLKIASISDFTTDKVEIELKLARGVYAKEVVDSLYAFTECERSISCNCLVIKDDKPTISTVSDIIRYHAGKLLNLLRQELELERDELQAELFARTLERIFIEERIYKEIETKRTSDAVIKAVLDGFKPFAKELSRKIGTEDVERLLKIPIRRISLYDIEKAKKDMERIQQQLAQNKEHLNHLVQYAIEILKTYIKTIESASSRRTRIKSFKKIEVKTVARHDFALRYDSEGGYLGTEVSGEKILEASKFDKILILRKNGIYTVIPLPDKFFAGQNALWITVAEKEALSSAIITLVYSLANQKGAYIKRTTIDSWLTGKDYSLVPEKAEILGFSIDTAYEFQLEYKPKPRSKKTKQIFHAKEYPIRKRQAQGIRLTDREVIQLEVLHAQKANIINPPSAHGGGLLEAALKKHKK
ncbi:MAG: DNA topoisomerase IV subunit A [Rectinema sp.]